MVTEYRTIRSDVQIVPPEQADGAHRFWARVLNYNVLDDYNTEWAPGVFGDAASPAYAYGHAANFDIRALLGHGVETREAPPGAIDANDPGGLDLCMQLDDFDAVPSARQVWAQLKSGTLREFSVGFGRQEDEPSEKFKDVPGARRITKAWLQEVSSVLTGAVPGTKLLAMSRSAGMAVDAQLVNQVLGRLALGEVDLADALIQIRSAAAPLERRQDLGGSDDDEDEEDGMCDVAVADLVALGQAIAQLDTSDDDGAAARAVVAAFQEILDDLDEAAGDGPDADDNGVTSDMMAALTERARWSKKFINTLPDAAFAHVADGGVKDDSGRTVPRSLRMFPHHVETGAVDDTHARNAAARIPQSDLSQAAQDKAAAHVKHHMDDPKWSHAFTRAAPPARDASGDAAAEAEVAAALAWVTERR